MLEAILMYLHNWFPVPGAERSGAFVIASGALDFDGLKPGQYYRIRGSVFNDGLHRRGEEQLTDEEFTGTVAPLAVPRALVEMSVEIKDWCTANPATDKISESFGGYSYSRASSASGGAAGGWQAAFAARLAPWRRPCE